LKIDAVPRFKASREQAARGFTELPMAIRHLHQVELADRWRISPRTLERWRWEGKGPRYLKLGGRVVYRLEDVEAFETEKIRESAQ
jgi:hypothetical protein